ncbi:hypothetical protein VPH35_023901 [Triticum aestivum]
MRPPRSNPLLLSFSLADPLHSRRRASRLRTISLSPSPSPSLPTLQQPMEAFGFDALKETFSVDVAAAEARPLNVPLATPLNIASSRLEDVANVAVRVELSSGAVGWGEAPALPSVTAEDQPAALAAIARACVARTATLGAVRAELSSGAVGWGEAPVLPSVTAEDQPAALAAIARACVARTATLGAVRAELSSGSVGWGEAPVLPSVTAEEQPAALAAIAHACAARTAPLGAVLQDVADALPGHTFASPLNWLQNIEDKGYTANHAIEVLDRLNEMGVTPVLFEQPVHRDDWEGLHDVSIAAMEKYRVAVAADESCRGLLDAQKIIHGNLAHVINIKPEKLGVLGALEVIDAARKAGIALMIGGMVETRIAMGFAGHLATGLDCFRLVNYQVLKRFFFFCGCGFIDLDTPLLLSEDSVYGGYEACNLLSYSTSIISFWTCLQFKNARGHGGFLHLDNNNGWK